MKLMQSSGNLAQNYFKTAQNTFQALMIMLAVYELWLLGADLAWIDPRYIANWVYDSHYYVWGQFVPLEVSSEGGNELMKLARILHEFPRQMVLGFFLGFEALCELLKRSLL